MKALSGRRILITRAHHQAAALAAALENEGAEVIAIPSIEIAPPESYEPLDSALRNLERFDWLVLTSVNGVEALAQRLRALSQKILKSPSSGLHPGRFLKVAAMGPATAQALEAHGISVGIVPEKYVAESLVDALRDQVFDQSVLLVRAESARDVVPVELEKAGARVHVIPAYRTIVPESSCESLRQLFRGGPMPDAVTFTSSSTVINFFRLLQEASTGGWPPAVAAASIGPITTRTLLDHGIEPVVQAKEFTIPGLVDALCRWYAAQA